MSTYTTNLNLIKPSYDDDIDVEQLNNNMDVLDTRVNAVIEVNDTQDTRLTALENKTYPYLPLTGGTVNGNLDVTGTTNLVGDLMKNNVKVKQLFTTSFKSLKEFDLKDAENMSVLDTSKVSIQIFQDPETLWTEMYAFVLCSSGDRWLKFKSPVKWVSRDGVFIACGLGYTTSFDTQYDNTCTWIDNSTFYFYLRGLLYNMYHFAGYASEKLTSVNGVAVYNDSDCEKRTALTNNVSELADINNSIKELECATLSADDEVVTYQDGRVKIMTQEESSDLYKNLIARRNSILNALKECE